MGKLAGRGLAGRLGRAPGRLPARVTEAGEATPTPWKKWYSTARWQGLRRKCFARDGFTCAATGVPVFGRYPAPDSPVLDHIAPHRGDPALFWDEDNLQTVSKAWHDSEKQRLEKAGRA